METYVNINKFVETFDLNIILDFTYFLTIGCQNRLHSQEY